MKTLPVFFSSIILLFFIFSGVLSVESLPTVVNLTRLSTYSYKSPELVPPVSSEGKLKAQIAGRPTDSSAAESELSGQSLGAQGTYGNRHPAQLLGKPSGEGHWATPAPHAGIVLPYVPYKMFAQVRHTYEVNHKPQSDAIASATTAEEAAAAARLRESIQTKKISEVYSEEGYEDSAYDHAGFKKDAGFSEGHEAHKGAKSKKGQIGHDGSISEAETSSNEQKYPFHKIPASESVSVLSPLRYALNPASEAIPRKSDGGSEFYESTDNVECPIVVDLPPIPGRRFAGSEEEGEEGEEGEATEEDGEKTPKPAPTPAPPPTPRLKGLGNKIDCLKRKYFGGDEPLDNPLFKEHVVNVAKNEIKKAKEEAETSQKEVEAKPEESKEVRKKTENKMEERIDGKIEDTEVPTDRSKSVGEDRIGVESEESMSGSVGAAVEGLPSGPATDADMQGFYADIMGHIRSAAGNIVRQAYRGNDGSNSDNQVSRVRPPKPPKPPIIGFFPTQGEGPTAANYPSILPAPSNPSYRNYAADDDSYEHKRDVDEDEEEEEYAGSEREEEEEEEDDDNHQHQHHDHRHSKKPATAYLLRPVQPSQAKPEAPFRPSQLLYVHNPSAQRGTAPSPSLVSVPPSPYQGEPPQYHPPHQQNHHHHHRHPHTFSPNSITPFQSGGIRTFLIPKKTVPLPTNPYRFQTSPFGSVRGPAAILVPSSNRQHPSSIFASGFLYPFRDSPTNSLKRHVPAGSEFDGLLTATTQMTSLALPPIGFKKPLEAQPVQDLVSSPSIVTYSIETPRNIEYFTAKDSLPPRKKSQDYEYHPLQESRADISQITFTTTEKSFVPTYIAESTKSATSHRSTVSSFTAGSDSIDTAERSELMEPSASSVEESMEVSASSLEETVANPIAANVGNNAGIGVSARLVTEQVTKGIIRGAIEEASKKRKKNSEDFTTVSPSISELTDTETKTRREKIRSNYKGTQEGNVEEQLSDTTLDTDGEVEIKSKRNNAVRLIGIQRDRSRRGERGNSRTRIGLTKSESELNSGSRVTSGRKRGEPRYNLPALDARNDEEYPEESELSGEYYTSEEKIGSPNSERSYANDRMSAMESRVAQISRRKDSFVDNSSSIEPVNTNSGAQIIVGEVIPRKMFVEPRVRGEKRPKIPKKSMARPRVTPTQLKTKQESNIKERPIARAVEPRTVDTRRESDSTVGEKWEASKGRIIPSLEDVADGNRRQSRTRENTRTRTRSTTIRPIVVAETGNRDKNNERVMRHREVKETFTSVYNPEK